MEKGNGAMNLEQKIINEETKSFLNELKENRNNWTTL